VSLTFDDGSINQFRKAVPILTSWASRHVLHHHGRGARLPVYGTFTGRDPQAIVRETAHVPTGKDNLFERAAAIGHLGLKGALDYHRQAGELYEDGKLEEAYRTIDEGYAKVRAGALAPRSEPGAEGGRDRLTWDQLRELARRGHEVASHTVTHPRLAVLDEPNLVYELEKSRQEILDQVGPKHTFSVECPYGTEDERAVALALARYPAARNRMPEPFLQELNRGSQGEPGTAGKEYVQWQRGPLTRTPLPLMKSWIDLIAAHDNVWLVLVFHGVDGIGWEPKTSGELREYFEYIKSKQSRLWVATFQDATKYMRERAHALLEARRRGSAIDVALRHDLDHDLYDLPLTLRTQVPAGWSAVQARQGTSVQRVEIDRDRDRAWATYQAVPNAGTVTLAEAKPKPRARTHAFKPARAVIARSAPSAAVSSPSRTRRTSHAFHSSGMLWRAADSRAASR
jgi:peptidoglycan/xylan/chitin deacetylase (PgdA/CDA1 family)